MVRNRARRRLRVVAERILPGHAKPEYDFVLIARAATATRPFDALLDDLKAALKRVGAWRDDELQDVAGKRGSS